MKRHSTDFTNEGPLTHKGYYYYCYSACKTIYIRPFFRGRFLKSDKSLHRKPVLQTVEFQGCDLPDREGLMKDTIRLFYGKCRIQALGGLTHIGTKVRTSFDLIHDQPVLSQNTTP